ncbi:SDR family NAD(P)-dependent oxidoreductase [Oryzicola mucosus]|uniref:SDR family oxidoreductase n=1 Tax=Oryzicola mucosus TaxID=2767425 RepID=A0A8J6U283_9HYPH|nr:SDR family oxidoreductase [Oryzicola mucosus]MBD0415543.1 SDR family oxidoreductase [Oryzicola mucosus]
MSLSLQGRVAFISGSGHGIGRATARRMAELGAIVGVNDLKQEFVDEAVAEIEAAGGRAIGITCNVASRDGVRSALAELVERTGRLDILVNNAAWVRYQAVPDIASDTMDRMLDIGFKSVVWGIQAATELMDEERGGVIVNVASTAGYRSAANSIVYSGIKAGVMGITRAAAAELGARNIRVNAVAPSAIPTEGTQKHRSAERDAKRVATTPLGRLGTVEDIANAICFLASDAANFITSETLLVDGGITWTNL